MTSWSSTTRSSEFAAATGCLSPLDELIEAPFLADQAANSVGPSHRSYSYGGHQWALATDAAGHMSARTGRTWWSG